MLTGARRAVTWRNGRDITDEETDYRYSLLGNLWEQISLAPGGPRSGNGERASCRMATARERGI